MRASGQACRTRSHHHLLPRWSRTRAWRGGSRAQDLCEARRHDAPARFRATLGPARTAGAAGPLVAVAADPATAAADRISAGPTAVRHNAKTRDAAPHTMVA